MIEFAYNKRQYKKYFGNFNDKTKKFRPSC